MSDKTLSDKVTEQISMAPLHLTGLTAVTAVFNVLGSLLTGQKPAAGDIVRASGLVDTDSGTE